MRQTKLDRFIKPKDSIPPAPAIIPVSPNTDKIDRLEAKIDHVIFLIKNLTIGGAIMKEKTITVKIKKKEIALMRPEQKKSFQMVQETKGAFGNELKAALQKKANQ